MRLVLALLLATGCDAFAPTLTGRPSRVRARVVACTESTPPTTPYAQLLSTIAPGDAVALFVFAAIWRSNHGTDAGSALQTAAPFLFAWVLLAPPLGAYRRDAGRTLSEATLAPLPALAVAVPAGCALRGLLQGHVPALPFWVVALIACTVLVEAWRAVHYLVIEQTSDALDDFVAAIVDDDD